MVVLTPTASVGLGSETWLSRTVDFYTHCQTFLINNCQFLACMRLEYAQMSVFLALSVLSEPHVSREASRKLSLANEAKMRCLRQLIPAKLSLSGRYTGAPSNDVIAMSLKRGGREPKTEVMT